MWSFGLSLNYGEFVQRLLIFFINSFLIRPYDYLVVNIVAFQ